MLNRSNKLDSPGRNDHHPQQQPTMLPAADIGGSVGTFAVTDGQVNNFTIQFGRAEDEIEIPEWIEIAEVGAVRRDALVVRAEQHFCSA